MMHVEGEMPSLFNLEQNKTVYTDCPCCGYKKAMAITRKENGQTLYYCHAGCAQNTLWGAIHNLEPRSPTLASKSAPKSADAFIRCLWDTSHPAPGTTVETYLRSRGIVGSIPPSLRFLPDHPHKPTKTRWPIMLAAIVSAGGELRALHRTYVRLDGSGKSVEPAKMSLGKTFSLSCHLGEATEELAVTEGIETGLSFQLSTSIPTWAALSTGGMRSLILPDLPMASFITIAADADEPGLKAAEEAALRWREDGRHVRIVAPPMGRDFNDMLIKASL